MIRRLLHRSCPDDGGLTALLLAPMISLTMLCLSMRQLSVQGAQPSLSVLPLQWLIDPPLVLTGSAIKHTALEALVLSRRNLVQTLSMCSLILMVHLWASSRAEEAAANSTSPRAEDRTHIPKNELQRTIEYSKLVLGTTVGLLLVRFAASVSYDKLWSGKRPIDSPNACIVLNKHRPIIHGYRTGIFIFSVLNLCDGPRGTSWTHIGRTGPHCPCRHGAFYGDCKLNKCPRTS